ncbi:MAG: SPOR domain-containing protein [Bacteroidetes bacterium]|nr:SPOR domain-containing protein [Bacteroidota bacterium]
MKKNIFHYSLLIIFLLVGPYLKAAMQDTIIIQADARMEMFSNEEIAVNKRTANMTSGGLYKGYRLQVISTRSREEAFKLKAWFLQNEPSQKAYLLFQSPYFKVRVGNFLTKSDALDFKKEIARIYSQPVYVVEDAVEYTPPDNLIP